MPVSRSGGWQNTSRPAGIYQTTFPLTENPISESGRWTNGDTVGLDWQDIQTNGSEAYGVAVSAGYDDCLACLSGFNDTSHYAQGTVYKAGGYSPGGGASHEVELLAGWTISAHVAKGYECTWDISASGPQLVRWNGASGNFTLTQGANDNAGTGKSWTDVPSGSGSSQLANGDVVKFTYSVSGSVVTLTVYQNGVQVFTCQDTSPYAILSGQPGMGLFGRTGATMSSYCWAAFEAG